MSNKNVLTYGFGLSPIFLQMGFGGRGPWCSVVVVRTVVVVAGVGPVTVVVGPDVVVVDWVVVVTPWHS